MFRSIARGLATSLVLPKADHVREATLSANRASSCRSAASESASIVPRAPRALVDASFTNVLHTYDRRGRGGLQCPLQPTKKRHTINPGLQQTCFYPNKGIGQPLLLFCAV